MGHNVLYTDRSGYTPYDSGFLRDPPAFCISLRRLRSVYRLPDPLCIGIQKSAETMNTLLPKGQIYLQKRPVNNDRKNNDYCQKQIFPCIKPSYCAPHSLIKKHQRNAALQSSCRTDQLAEKRRPPAPEDPPQTWASKSQKQ